jgi:riboflavin-specific deaminase-like protein
VLDDDALLRLYSPDDRTTPCLRLNFVTSLDGAVSVDGRSAGLSGPEDKQVFGLLRTMCDALLVGAGTLRHEGYDALTFSERRRAARVAMGLAADPPLVILSRRLDLAPEHPMFTRAPVRPIVLTPRTSPAGRRAALARVADVVVAGTITVDLAAGLAELHRRGLRQVLCEGGPEVLGSLTAADLVDELCLTVAPLLVGPGPGRISTGPPLVAPRRSPWARFVGDVLLLRYTRSAHDRSA